MVCWLSATLCRQCAKAAAPVQKLTAHLHRHPVLIHGQDLPRGVSVQRWEQDAEGGAVPTEGLVGDEVVRHILRAQLDGGLALGQGIGLCKEVAHQLVVVGHHLALQTDMTDEEVMTAQHATVLKPLRRHLSCWAVKAGAWEVASKSEEQHLGSSLWPVAHRARD